MSRTKKKRILLTIAVVVALVFVAAMVLHRHEEPKVIGNLSKEDVAEISKLFLKAQRESYRFLIADSLRARDFRMVTRAMRGYAFTEVAALHVLGSSVSIRYRIGTNEFTSSFHAFRAKGGWKVVDIEI